MRWKKVTLVGVGLLGGSLGLALRQRGLAGSVVGFVRRAASVRECQRVGAVNRATRDLRAAVADADLIVLCTPIAQMPSLVAQMRTSLKTGAVLTDVGSVKQSVVRDLEPLVHGSSAHFIGSHPMAGSEKMGVMAARADLFARAICVVTPTRHSNRNALGQIEQLWRGVGAQVLRLTPARHDELVSRSSHLPHLLAATLANLVLDPAAPKSQAALCANGFRDTTRIASGSPEMWRDIAVANQKCIARALDSFMRALQKVQRAVKSGDARTLERFLAQAKSRRERWHAIGTTGSPE